MEDKDQAIRELHEKIEALARKHKSIYDEIQELHNQVFELDLKGRTVSQPVTPIIKHEAPEHPVTKIEIPQKSDLVIPVQPKQGTPTPPVKNVLPKTKTPIEEFIGANLLNKIGIAILVLGIGFGTKYSIDHNLIDPLTRIIIGYFWGLALVGLSIRIKKSHHNFSAVLLSGGLAVFYFVTFAAYEFYELIPQTAAFILMVIFTAFTVFASVQYNREVIGVVGLVGAYAVPFLLSDGSGRVVVLFSYITIINTGILVLAFRKHWKWLYYLAFVLTWASFSAWFSTQYNEENHLWISLGFSTIFFTTFYITFLAYKLIKKEPLSRWDLTFMLFNSFIYYSFGYAAIDSVQYGDQFLGLFTLFTALIHFIACVIIFKQKQFKDIFYFVAGMVLVFLTLTVPVQLDGNWVTVIWAMEAALLFWIGRTKRFAVYEYLSYPLMLLSFISLTHDWSVVYDYQNAFLTELQTALPLFVNIQFITSILVAASFFFILWLASDKKYPTPFSTNTMYINTVLWSIAAIGMLILYLAFYLEIEFYWNQRYASSVVTVQYEYGDYPEYNEDMTRFKNIWLICYSALFALVLSIIHLKWLKDKNLTYVSMAINAIVIGAMLTIGIYELRELRSTYLNDAENQYYIRDIGHISIRYLMLILAASLLMINHLYAKNDIFNDFSRTTERVLFHFVTIILLSSELVHWLDMAYVQDSFKLGLSILWGSYALGLIVYGLKANVKALRMMAIVIFALTLIKLFVYDIADMSTISKTIVMIVLGILLLVSSFLYNKVKRTPHEAD